MSCWRSKWSATALAGAALGTAGLVGLAIGFAFRDLVENYIASVLLSLRRPFDPGDLIDVDGQEGKVIRLTSRATILMTRDGNHLRIPNAQVFKGVILNYTRNPQRRLHFAIASRPSAPPRRTCSIAPPRPSSTTTGVKRLIAHLKWLRERLLGTFWFVPTVLTVAAAVAGVALPSLDRRLGDPVWLPLALREAGAEGVREVLAAIAGSMITVAGVTFSVLMVALAQAAQLFGHRLLRNAFRDRGNQVALGSFVATFVYCTLVLMRVRGEGPSEMVPRLSFGLAIMLTLGSVGVLIYFLHHAASLLQWARVIQHAGDDLDRAILQSFPEHDADSRPDPDLELFYHGAAVGASSHGYVARVDDEALLRLAAEADLRIRLHARTGEFVLPAMALATVVPAERLTDRCRQRLVAALPLEDQPQSEGDVLLGIHRLVEIALRALSPALNNPLTAMDALNRLGVSLAVVGARGTPPSWLLDEAGVARVRVKPVTVAETLEEAFGLLRDSLAAQAAVAVRAVEILTVLALGCRAPELLAAIAEQGAALDGAAAARLDLPGDREAVRAAVERLRGVVDAPPEREDALLLRDQLLARRGTGAVGAEQAAARP